MKRLFDIVPRWLPSLLVMLIIFAFSSRASDEFPDLRDWDYFLKKGAHVIIYGLLALSYLHLFPERKYKLAWLLAIIYAGTDEFHQSFVPGRHAAITDVLVFDNLGALIALFIHARWSSRAKPVSRSPRRGRPQEYE